MSIRASMTVPASRELGRCLARGAAPSVTAILAFGLGLGISVGCLLGAGAALVTGIGTWQTAAAVVGAMTLAGAAMASRGWMRRRVEVAVHENGLVLRTRRGWTVRSWGQVLRVFERTVEVKRFFRKRLEEIFVFEDRRGGAIVLDATLPDHVALGRLASELAQDAMLAGYQAAADTGGRLDFGAITIDEWGVHLDEGAYPWSRIAFVRWEVLFLRTSLAIHLTSGETIRIPSGSIANERIVLALLGRRRKLAPISSLTNETAPVAA